MIHLYGITLSEMLNRLKINMIMRDDVSYVISTIVTVIIYPNITFYDSIKTCRTF